MPSPRSDNLVPLRAAAQEGLDALTGEPSGAPATCRTCGGPTEPVQYGRWALRPSECATCVRARADAERKREMALRGHEGLTRAGIPEKYRAYTFERVVKQAKDEPWTVFAARVQSAAPPAIGITRFNVAAARLMREWSPGDGSVYISGHVGGGKSTLAAAAIRQLCERGVPCRYLVEGTLRELTAEQVGIIASTPVIFWDDWSSTARPPEWMRDRVESLVMRRYERCLPVIFTSNDPLSSATDKWGARVGSRLHEMVGGRREEIVDHDWRTGQAYGAAAAHV